MSATPTAPLAAAALPSTAPAPTSLAAAPAGDRFA
jgi:hypothetical protein